MGGVQRWPRAATRQLLAGLRGAKYAGAVCVDCARVRSTCHVLVVSSPFAQHPPAAGTQPLRFCVRA
jgi:hypothetical protein